MKLRLCLLLCALALAGCGPGHPSSGGGIDPSDLALMELGTSLMFPQPQFTPMMQAAPASSPDRCIMIWHPGVPQFGMPGRYTVDCR